MWPDVMTWSSGAGHHQALTTSGDLEIGHLPVTYGKSDTASVHIADGIAWLSFNRPEKRNCMSPELNRRMFEILEEIEFRDDFGVLVLKGEGSAWSAGMDLKEYFRENEVKGLGAVRQAQGEAYRWWRRLRWFRSPPSPWSTAGASAAATPPCSPAIWQSPRRRPSSACRRSTGAFFRAAAPARWRSTCFPCATPCTTP
jgi:hypothetical protein